MRKSRIILLILFVSLSFVVFRAMGDEGNRYIVDQAAVVKGSAASLEEAIRPTVLAEGTAPEVSPLPALEIIRPIGTSTVQGCGGGIGSRYGLARYLNSNETPFERGTGNRWPIASITKLMTAVIAAEQGMLDRRVVFTEEILVAEGSAGGFAAGEVMSGNDVLKGMLLISSNDAAEALAQAYDRDVFVRLMNEKAKELRMFDTVYVDPSGLSPRNQSTANDLYRLMGYLYDRHPELLQVTRQRKAVVTDLRTNKKRTILNIDQFAGQANFIGGKTGYIIEAEGDGNLVTLFTRNGQPFVIVVLGSPDRFGETKKLLTCI